MQTFTKAFLIGLTLHLTFGQNTCPSGYNKFGRKCIKFESTIKKFEDAQNDCESVPGGRLFEPESKLEQDLILSNSLVLGASYIGLKVTGSSALYATSSIPVPFTDYFPNSPNNRGDCILAFVPPTRIFNHKAWSDADCHGMHRYICEAGPFTCESDNALFVSEFGPQQTPEVCSIKCRFTPSCTFFIRRTSDGACVLRTFPPTARFMIPGFTSGEKNDPASDGLLVGKLVTASDVRDCQSQCCYDDHCQSAIFKPNTGECAFDFAPLAKKLPLSAGSGFVSVPKQCI